jgi:hypothetical protein
MKFLSEEKELCMQNAIERVKNGESARSVAATYRLNHVTLSRRVRNNQYTIQGPTKLRLLSPEAEDFVCDWIISEEVGGRAPTTRQLRSFIALVLQEDNLPVTIGHKWVDRFRHRHQNRIRLKKNRLIVYKKVMTSRLDEIEHWFRRLQRIIEARGITPSNIWNMDETGLQEGFQRNSKVFGSTIIRSRDRPSNDNTAWISIIECVGAEGRHITPGAIFTGGRLWTDSTPEPAPNWIYSSSYSGFSNQHMMISWFKQAFLVDTRPSCALDWRLLLMDNHGSHMTEEFGKLALENHVQPFYLPSNSSHELQPLDVGCFSSLKDEYGHQIEDIGIFDITAAGSRRRFVEAYKEASKQAFTEKNIRSGFSHSGIWPFRPEHVLERLKPPSPPSPPFTPPSQQRLPDIPPYLTPQNARQLRQQINSVFSEVHGVNRKHKIMARTWVKAFDVAAAQRASDMIEKARLGAEADANRKMKRRKVKPKDGELFVSIDQIEEAKGDSGVSKRAPPA